VQTSDSLAVPSQTLQPADDKLTDLLNTKPITRLWWLTFIVILLAGAALFGTGYRHGLPFIDYPDEMTIWTFGHAYMDPSWVSSAPNYPPGLLIVSSLIQRALFAATGWEINVSATIEVMRLLSVIMALITLGLIMILAYRFAGPIAGVVAGLCWLVLPLANNEAKLAIANSWLAALVMASLVTGIEGWSRKSVGWLIASVILGTLAALFKWQGAAVLSVAGLGCLTFWKVNRRRAIVLSGGYTLLMGALAYWAVFIFNALAGDVYLPGAKPAPPTLMSVLINLEFQTAQVGPIVVYGRLPLVALVLGWLLPAYRKRLYMDYAFWTLPIVVLAYNVVISFSGAPVFERHYLAGSAVLCVMAGVGAALIWQAVRQIENRLKLNSDQARLVLTGVALILAIVLLIALTPQTARTIQASLNSQLPDRRVDFAHWASTTATAGPMLITDPELAAAVDTLYGYQGRPIDKPFNQGTSVYPPLELVTDQLLTEGKIRYVVSSPEFLSIKNEQLTLPLLPLLNLKTDNQRRGNSWAAYYIGAISQLRSAVFGNEIVLRGFNLSADTICQGDSVTTQFFWSPGKRPTRYYSSYVHLAGETTGEQSYPINGADLSADRPTLSWVWPEETLVGPAQPWIIPADLPPAEYHLWLGVFEPQSGQRLKLPDGSDHDTIATINVMDCRRAF
jgi:hypothetical protein